MKKIYDNKKLIILISCIVILIVFLLSFINKEKNTEEEISLNTLTKITETTTKDNESFYVDIKGNVKNTGVYKVLETQTIQDVINLAGGLKKNSYTDNINLSKLVTDEMVIYIHSKKEIEKIKELNNCTCTPIYSYIECKNEETSMSITTSTTVITTMPITSKITTSNSSETTTKLVTTTNPIIISQTTETTTTIPIIQSTTITKKDDKININTCTIEDLMTLKGLGESKAKNIIEYRNNNGLFNSIEDLLNVNGIGSKTIENIKEFIEV